MPWQESSIMDQRISFVILALKGEQGFGSLCDEYGISRPTGYRWLHRYQEAQSYACLGDRSHRPEHCPRETDAALVAAVVAERQAHGWGAKKLQKLLKDQGIELSLITINRILKRKGLVRERDAHRPAPKRFERETPNELVQIDFKGRFRVEEGYCYPFSMIDDHSRFALGLYALKTPDAKETYEAIVKTFNCYGVPKAMLMDHGSPWWSTHSGDGITWLTVQLVKQDIRVYNSGFHHPQTQGKVEAFHRTIDRAFDHHGLPKTLSDSATFFDNFVREYNYVRPHEGIGMVCPASRYHASEVAYNPAPPAWQYADDLVLSQVNSEGSITYNGRRHFVAKPLAREIVAVQDVGGGKLLVRYRDQYIREIDLTTGSTHPFSRPVHDDLFVE
jgi:transposase InsO family protein